MQSVAWIQSDLIPDSDITVLLYKPDSDNPVDVGFHDGERWHDYNGAELRGKDQVTHWMPLPDPPGQGNDRPAGFCGDRPPCRGQIEGQGGCIHDCIHNDFF